MKNKTILKIILLFLGFLFLFILVNHYEYRMYTKNFNVKIMELMQTLEEEYPNLTEREIIAILNRPNTKTSDTLKKYSLDLNNRAIIQKNDQLHRQFLIINIALAASGLILILVIFIISQKRRNHNIREITQYIAELNRRNYRLKIDSNTEDELSILKNEIYKTTVMLKETAENTKKDKSNLKQSLEDISHQIKTPLTSILVMLDNLIDEPDMDLKTRCYFLSDIKRNILNINFLVQTLLKLSRFDANAIHFTKESWLLKDIIAEACKNVSPLCDLKNITLNIQGDAKILLVCDFKWQVEAITNILKNSVEYSFDNSHIDIVYRQNNAYKMIEIKDYGRGIASAEIEHIFERFYHGSSSSFDSVGIGLALAKKIIETDNGIVTASSNPDGTQFIIKYFN